MMEGRGMKKNCIFIFIVAAMFLAGPALGGSHLENLGGAVYRDLNLSFNQNQACQTCHHPSAGFADNQNRISPTLLPVSDGSINTFFGGRNAPTAAYAGFSPVFHYDGGLFVGGLFWDGRATGMDITATGELGAGPTGDPLADQAKGPFGNPVEMALTFDNTGFSTEEEVVAIIQESDYASQFENVFGPDAFGDTGLAYNNASLAIAAFERSENVNKFTSKFDKFVAEQGGDVSTFGIILENGFRKYAGPPAGFSSEVYSYDEADGLAIFNADSYTQLGVTPDAPNGGMCYACHRTDKHVVSDDATRPSNGPVPGSYNPILTDFTYNNSGIPVNPQIAVLAGPQPIDYGLGAQVAQLEAAFAGSTVSKIEVDDGLGGLMWVVPEEAGKFKVSSLRNISRTAPYGHNGFFAAIYDIVHFYNTRDVEGAGWPEPEVTANVNRDELGNLDLTVEQEQKLVLFLETLTD